MILGCSPQGDKPKRSHETGALPSYCDALCRRMFQSNLSSFCIFVFSFFLLSSHLFFRISFSYPFFLLHGITSQKTVATDKAVRFSNLIFLFFLSILVPISIYFSPFIVQFLLFPSSLSFFPRLFLFFYPYNSALPSCTPISFLFYSFNPASPS